MKKSGEKQYLSESLLGGVAQVESLVFTLGLHTRAAAVYLPIIYSPDTSLLN